MTTARDGSRSAPTKETLVDPGYEALSRDALTQAISLDETDGLHAFHSYLMPIVLTLEFRELLKDVRNSNNGKVLTMNLRKQHVPLLSYAVARGGLSEPISACSLPAVVASVTQGHFSNRNGSPDLLRWLNLSQNAAIRSALQEISSLARRIRKPSENAEDFEFFRLASTEDFLSDHWTLFCDRFGRRLQKGRTRGGFDALRRGLFEIADNVFEHAGNVSEEGCSGLAGFHFGECESIFSIADVGCGLLASLKQAPLWANLKSENEAIEAIVKKGATSRQAHEKGGGFSDLFDCLMEYNATVFLRSGDCEAEIYQGSKDRQLDNNFQDFLSGVQVSIVLKQSKSFREEMIF